MKRRPLLVAAAASLLAAGCAGAFIPEASPELVAAAAARGGDPGALAEGRALYVRKCSGCHSLYPPARFRDERWRKALDEMAPKAHLNEAERRSVENYLLAAAAIPPPAR